MKVKNVKAAELCTGCMACAAVCRHGAIRGEINAGGFYQASVDDDKCSDCGRCAAVCPQLKLRPARSAGAEEQVYPKFYAVLVNETLPAAEQSSTSGLAYLLSLTFMRSFPQSCAAGCVFDAADNTVKHRVVDNPDDLALFCGSKYVQSSTEQAVSAAVKKVRTGPVLFIGTPCQTAGLKAAVPAKLQHNLFTIDLICHGVPSPRALAAYFKRLRIGSIEHLNFRYTEGQDWSAYNFLIKADGKIHQAPVTQDLFLQAFLSNCDLNACCYKCRYASTQRCGDLTVGDFWGAERILKDKRTAQRDKRRGVSLLIVSSRRGAELLEKLQSSGWITLIESTAADALKSNPVLSRPSAAPAAQRRWFLRLRRLLPYYTAFRLSRSLTSKRVKRRMKRAVLLTAAAAAAAAALL